MKIKTDTAIKVLSPYIGQPVLYVAEKELGGQYYPKEKLELAGVREHNTAPFLLSLLGNYVSADKFRLILKPISSITDEDAIDLCKTLGFQYHEPKIGREQALSILDRSGEYDLSPLSAIETYQFLQSKGYDLPNYLLGDKTLFESGLAIYEN